MKCKEKKYNTTKLGPLNGFCLAGSWNTQKNPEKLAQYKVIYFVNCNYKAVIPAQSIKHKPISN